MDKRAKELISSIDSLKKKLETKEAELGNIQKNCNHDWPDEWSERVGRDYGCMSGAVDSVFRQSEPEIIAVYYKTCQNCGKEKTKR